MDYAYAVPIILLGAVAVFYALRKHKEKPPTDHVLKL
jgi:hypothetical protein